MNKATSIILIFMFLSSSLIFLASADNGASNGIDNFFTKFNKVGRYIFGSPPTDVVQDLTSALIITIAVWLLIVVTFGDIIANFSSFSATTSWVIAICIGIIAANLGAVTGTITTMTGWFAKFGTAAVYIALGTAFLAFLAVNFGVIQLAPWVMRRKAMMEAAKAEAGGKELAGTIRGIEEVGEALREAGKKVKG